MQSKDDDSQGGSRLSEFRKIAEEIFRKISDKSELLKSQRLFQWLFTKKYKISDKKVTLEISVTF